MTRWQGWTTCHGIVAAFKSGRIQTKGDIATVKALLLQADRDQVRYVYDQIADMVTPYGIKVLFGRRIPVKGEMVA